eukprot:c26384_g1_i1 orf=1-168(-)
MVDVAQSSSTIYTPEEALEIFSLLPCGPQKIILDKLQNSWVWNISRELLIIDCHEF